MSLRRLARSVLVGTVVVAVAGAACSSEPERSVANFCSQAEMLRTIDEDLATGDPVKIQARADDLRLLQQVSPGDIEPSVAVLVGVTDDFARSAGTATDRDQVADEVFRGRSGDIPAIEAAGSTVAAYTRDNCHVDLGGSTPGTGRPDGTATTAPPDTGGGRGGPTTATTATPPTSGAPGQPSTTTTTTPSLLVD